MMRVAIVGCGKIADQHVQAIHRIPESTVVAVCDREALMAGQLAARFGIPRQFTDVGQMLADATPDVVHITTPPQSHHDLGKQCLEAGSHVYLEKPFTVTAEQAQTLTGLAENRNLVVTAGHWRQYAAIDRPLARQRAIRLSHCRRRCCLPAMTSPSANRSGSLDQRGSSGKVGKPGQIRCTRTAIGTASIRGSTLLPPSDNTREDVTVAGARSHGAKLCTCESDREWEVTVRRAFRQPEAPGGTLLP